MSISRFGPNNLLEYHPKYSLLICRECHFAIQKNALDYHLLRHKILRSDKQRLLYSLAPLDLLEPDRVPLPAPGLPPIDSLPIFSGYRCIVAACKYLTINVGRMRSHWTSAHGRGGSSVPLFSSFACPVKLQTFFRTNKVRYFEVVLPTASPVTTNEDGGNRDNDDDEGYPKEGHNGIRATVSPPPPRGGSYEEGHNGIRAIATPSPPHGGYHEEGNSDTRTTTTQPPPPPRMLNPPWAASGRSSANFDLETLTYFYHFINVTSLTLPGFGDTQSVERYWQVDVVLQALQQRWLMCGLLAISARHLATLTDNISAKEAHLEREKQLSSEFTVSFGQSAESGLDSEVVESEREARKIGEQIKCLLCCASMLDHEWMAPCQVQWIVSNIQGCAMPDSVSCYNHIRMDDGELQEGLFAIQTACSSRNTPPVLLNRLCALPLRIAEALGKPDDTEDAFATLSAISTMVECCDVSFARNESNGSDENNGIGPTWQGVAMWLAKLSDHFKQMISCNHPAALMVVAHWAAILIKRAEQAGCWFLKGSAKIIILQITRELAANCGAVVGLVESMIGIVDP